MNPTPERPPVCLAGRACPARPANRRAHHPACPVAVAADVPPLTFRSWLLAHPRWRQRAWVNDRRVIYHGTPERYCLYRQRLIARGYGAYEVNLREAWNAYAGPLHLPVADECATGATQEARR